MINKTLRFLTSRQLSCIDAALTGLLALITHNSGGYLASVTFLVVVVVPVVWMEHKWGAANG